MFEEHTSRIKRTFLCSGEQYFKNQHHLHFTTQQRNGVCSSVSVFSLYSFIMNYQHMESIITQYNQQSSAENQSLSELLG